MMGLFYFFSALSSSNTIFCYLWVKISGPLVVRKQWYQRRVRENMSVWVWGWSNEGVLGLDVRETDSDNDLVLVPTRVPFQHEVVGIASGMWHTHFLTASREIYSCGRTANGRLGFHSDLDFVQQPTLVPSQYYFVQVACGHHHSVAINTRGQVVTWGSGYSGQCGHGNRLDSETPQLVENVSEIKYVKVCAGYYHTMALDEDQNLWVWGTGKEGQLGLGKETFRPDPKLLLVDKKKIMCISAGEFNSAAITCSGELYLWGNNKYGQLGNSKLLETCMYTPTLLRYLADIPLVWKAITIGSFHVVAITGEEKRNDGIILFFFGP
eukprot:TRINITY_DN4180_c0_g1_i1.p1 TRINITY_DN4180_c0_g1~~TRINITY_DN4180_c0_g1_i1.p1  ORF type:complete len:324 (+),score=67.35 TRINITY_DN4180_c0_g1_i1:508-1479(+)